MELILDEVRVRVSSWVMQACCSSDIYGLLSPYFCLSFNVLKFTMVFMMCWKDEMGFKLTQS